MPVRDSGRLEATPQVTIEGPAGSFTTDGLIIAARHVHTNPADAARLGIEDGEYVDVRVNDEDRPLTFGRTLVRVGKDTFTEVHIDTDEANAAGIEVAAAGELVQV